MAGIDSSIYFQQQPIDILGGIQRGLQMRDQIDQRQRQQQEMEQQAQIQKAYQAGVIQNPDGSYGYDQSKTLQMLAGAPGAGKAAFELSQNIYNQNLAKEKAKEDSRRWEVEKDLERQKIFSAAADRKEARDERRFQSGLVREEKMQALQTPYGLANTADDAKQLKEAHEAKANFDSKIQEMIDLRQKYGAEYLNREAVARGKQLSKDLLLEYKNMAKLGVLSKSDEDIINAIIPADPLAQDWAPGQDPILSNLQKFKGDSDRDFQNRVGTRTRSGLAGRPTDAISTLRQSTGGDLSLSPKARMIDSQAVQWAKQNPNDPRSKQILQMNGLGG